MTTKVTICNNIRFTHVLHCTLQMLKKFTGFCKAHIASIHKFVWQMISTLPSGKFLNSATSAPRPRKWEHRNHLYSATFPPNSKLIVILYQLYILFRTKVK